MDHRLGCGSCFEGTCDLTKGNWVHDIRKPLYSASCPFIESYSNCEMNGRPDSEFIHWKWKPKDCELPQINPKAFMESMRGQSIAFVGDSVNRNHFQSLLCILSQVCICSIPRNQMLINNFLIIYPQTFRCFFFIYPS